MSAKILKPSILVVEDEDIISAVIRYNLSKEGFQVQVADNGDDAIEIIKKNKPDLILLDWLLPSVSGIEVCKMVRNDPETMNIPIIMVSAKSEEFDRITGLDRGADDYMIKPFSPPELIARIKAIFRRIRPAFSGKILTFDDIEVNLSSYSVKRNNSEVKLSPIEFQILQLLMEDTSRVLSREELIDKIWGKDTLVSARTVDVHVTRLRKALLQASKTGEDIVKTIRLAGYTLKVNYRA